MWCIKCQADVAAMASPDNERLYCTTCSHELPRPAAVAPPAENVTPPPHRKGLSDPRELLARWAREDSLGALDAEGHRDVPRGPVEPSFDAPRRVRFDASHKVLPPQVPFIERISETARPGADRPAPATPSEMPHRDFVIHSGHPLNPPHFIAPPVPLVDKSSRWVTLVGQIFAYIGVGGLTVGSVLVLMGYFGGPPSYATTGWLITTAGQMLLFLGVITLVSGGMEQTTQEVARRIDSIGDRLIRIEAAWSEKPAPPHRPDADAA
jgi:hypothetical protein